jgi:hypothetical protein
VSTTCFWLIGLLVVSRGKDVIGIWVRNRQTAKVEEMEIKAS